MLIDVFKAVDATPSDQPLIRARSVEMTLPIEVWLRQDEDEATFIADLPVWRWRTAFDQTPGRMHITWAVTEP
jgi:hypothetical protein